MLHGICGRTTSMFALLGRRVAGKDTTWYQEETRILRPWRCPMPVPIVCLDDEVRHFAERFGGLFTKPQYQYFVTVLLALIESEGRQPLPRLLPDLPDHPS